MQKYFNSKKWAKSTKFIDFTSKEVPDIVVHRVGNYYIDAWCPNGYVIETSPLGQRVCRAMISYAFWDNRKAPFKTSKEDLGRGIETERRIDWKPVKDRITGEDDCRWK